jgi:transcriptional regulator with XRE-family HTH domain
MKGWCRLMNTEEYAKTIAKNLKRLAYEHNKTQADISRDLKINKQTLSSWMNGQRIPRMPNVDLLCEYFNCRRTDILEPYMPKPLERLTAFEKNIILAYRNAPEAMQDAVLVLLGLTK